MGRPVTATEDSPSGPCSYLVNHPGYVQHCHVLQAEEACVAGKAKKQCRIL